MKNNNITSTLFLLVFFLISCNQNSKTVDKINTDVKDTNSKNNIDFEEFQANFKYKALENLNELGESFNNHFLANEDTLNEVSKIHKENYLKNLNTENIYYGFKTKLPNKSIILTFFKHFGAENAKDGLVIDTSFFVSLVFNESGKFQSHFRCFGSNLTGEPPTYNMSSTFKQENDKLIITNYEYSTGQSYAEVVPLPGSDSIYQADLTVTKFYLDYKTSNVILISKSRSTAKVVESYRNPLPVYLRPVD
jgi:hypothetical protein